MLTRIKLKNFRAFREEIDVRIRPITILIGRNSAGKSTLIKFLLMLQQTLESSEAGFFVTEGRHATLGTFQDLKNSMSRSNSFQFTLEIETNDLPEPAIQQIRGELQQSKPIENLEGTSVDLNVNLRTSSTISTQDALEQETSVRVSAEIPARELLAQFSIVGSIPYSKSPRGKHSVTCNIGGNKIFKKQENNIRRTRFLTFPLPNSPVDILKSAFDNLYNDDNQPETTDCIFVHTAALSLCDLVTNDSDYTLSDDQKKRGDRKRSRSDKNKRKRRQKQSKLKSDAPNLPSRIEQIKEAIRINLDHEATDILTSLQAHEIYLYRS